MSEYTAQGISENVIRGAGATTFLAGTDTVIYLLAVSRGSSLTPLQSSSHIHAFFAMMTLHPNVAAKGQEELDRVVGRDRLPDLSDRESLPYIEAILKEVLRWQPALPLGKRFCGLYITHSHCISAVPHQTLKDDVYRGRYIPSGTMVLANAW